MEQDEDGRGFWLYDLKVETVLDGREPVCRHIEGESFRIEGETLRFEPGTRISMYALAALLPLLPVKQRMTDMNDWVTTDAEVACPDPHCGARFRITPARKALVYTRGHDWSPRRAWYTTLAGRRSMTVETAELCPGYQISRVIKGGWQLAGDHGAVDRSDAVRDMEAFLDADITTFDCADIYVGVEEMIGDFIEDLRRRRGSEIANRVRCTPNWCRI